MPTKKNFLGGQQNYNPQNGEYEPSLVGKNGNVVTDADGDGISHESSKAQPIKSGGMSFKEARAMNLGEKSKREDQQKPSMVQKSLEKQVSKNPEYQSYVDSIAKNKNLTDNEKEEYFYAFKDAYEKSSTYQRFGYMPSGEIKNELSNAYYNMASNYQYNKGYSQKQWDEFGLSEFEDKYGTEEKFVQLGFDAWEQSMTDKFGGISEDHQTLGNLISKEQPKNAEELKNVMDEFNNHTTDKYYQEEYEFYKNKLGFNSKKPNAEEFVKKYENAKKLNGGRGYTDKEIATGKVEDSSRSQLGLNQITNKHGDTENAPFIVDADGEKFGFDTKREADSFAERNKYSFNKIDVHEKTYMDARKAGKTPEEADRLANSAVKPLANQSMTFKQAREKNNQSGSKISKWGYDWTNDSVKHKDGRTIKIGDKIGDDFVTGINPETNTVFLNEDPNVDGGRDYSAEDLFKLSKKGGVFEGMTPKQLDANRKSKEKSFMSAKLSHDEQRKVDHITNYFDVWGKPSRGELQSVVNFYKLNKEMANNIFKKYGYSDEDINKLKF